MSLDRKVNLDPKVNLNHKDGHYDITERTRFRKARLARDARFDGLFFVGVKTTGIFCRPVCPATPPHEKNIDYFPTALAAHCAGLRPCLRCRPESAPGSPAWCGTQTTLTRALRLIDNGEWRDKSLPEFAQRLGVSDRYLRKLFQQNLGISPIKYANFRRVLFAKQLLQQTTLPVTEIAFMAGFGSTRRFNTVFNELLNLNPRQLRRGQKPDVPASDGLTVFLSYRPPYRWATVRDFYDLRKIAGLEVITSNSYSRSFYHEGYEGMFTASHMPDKHGFRVELNLTRADHTLAVIQRIRRLLDLDADSVTIASHLSTNPLLASVNSEGIRLPGMWSPFEAGVRAILGQQVSVKAAHNLVTRLVTELGKPLTTASSSKAGTPDILFPEPSAVAGSSLEFLAMPGKRREALRLLAQHMIENSRSSESHSSLNDDSAYQDWLNIPGIGPWTVQYTAFRMGDSDIFLAGDLGVKNALKKLNSDAKQSLDATTVSPWGSYATLLLWQSLSNDASDTSSTNSKLKPQ